MHYNEFGQEIPDQTPVELPLGFKRPESLTEQIRRMIQGEISRQAVAEGNESFEEANDFDVDEEDPEAYLTPYQVVGMQEEIPHVEERSNVVAEGAGGSVDGESGASGTDVPSGGRKGVAPADSEGDNDGGSVGEDSGKGVDSAVGSGGGTGAAAVRSRKVKPKA